MSATGLLRRLVEADVQLSTDGVSLHYDAPAGALTDELLDGLRRCKAELVGWLSAHDPDGAVVARSPAAYAQQELWRKHHAHPAPQVYNVTARITVHSRLDLAALNAAYTLVLERHPILRSRFAVLDGEPILETLAPRPVEVPVTDLGELAEDARPAAAEAVAQAEAGRPFPLEEAPALRVRVVRLADDQWVLLHCVHHIVCDATSLDIVFGELEAAYTALAAGQSPALPPVETRYADHVRRQRAYLAGPEADRLRRFWRAELAGAPLDFAWPTDRTPPGRLSGRGGELELDVPAEVSAGLRRVARELGTTLYVVLLSGYALALSRRTGQDQVVVATSNANRRRPEDHRVVGLLADRLPIRVRPAEAQTFRDLVGQVGRTFFTAMDHGMLPFSLLVPAARPDWSTTRPFPSVLFSVLNRTSRGLSPTAFGGRLESVSATGLARMELYCILYADEDGLLGAIEYSTDLFDHEWVSGWAKDLVALLGELARDPDVALRPPSPEGA